MKPEDIKDNVTMICKKLKVRKPKIKLNPRGRRGKYYSRQRMIDIHLNCWRGIEQCVLHELAHHLEYTRNGGRSAEPNTAHGATFVACLVQVTNIWYGHHSEYDWSTEYSTVQKIYNKKYIKEESNNTIQPHSQTTCKRSASRSCPSPR